MTGVPASCARRIGRAFFRWAGLAVLGAAAGALAGIGSLVGANLVHGEFPSLARSAGMAQIGGILGALPGAVLGPVARLFVRRMSLPRLTLVITAGAVAGATAVALLAALADAAQATLFLLIPGAFVGYVLVLAGCWIVELHSPGETGEASGRSGLSGWTGKDLVRGENP